MHRCLALQPEQAGHAGSLDDFWVSFWALSPSYCFEAPLRLLVYILLLLL